MCLLLSVFESVKRGDHAVSSAVEIYLRAAEVVVKLLKICLGTVHNELRKVRISIGAVLELSRSIHIVNGQTREEFFAVAGCV